MSALRLPSTASTRPHLYVKAADDGHPQDVLLVLRLGIVQDHRTVTVWAVRRERDGDLLIHPAGNRSGGPLPVCRARLASRRLRVTFGFPLGKRCGASLVRAQGLFQLLPQALVLRQCALQLLLQGLDSPFEFLLPIRGANAIGGLHPFHDDTNAEICSELSLKVLYLLSYPLVNILVRTDARMDNGLRWLTVGPKGQPELQVIPMKIDGPNFDKDTAASLRRLLEQGILCGGVLESSDCRQDYEDLKAKGVAFSAPPVERFYGVEAVMKDNSGNWLPHGAQGVTPWTLNNTKYEAVSNGLAIVSIPERPKPRHQRAG